MLSQNVTQNLSRALREAVRQATEDNLSNPSVTSAHVIAALRQLCNETLSESLRSSSLRRPELPTEIWGYIWESLDLVDRVAISHVSRAWRAAALRNPRLWSEINISSSRHYDETQLHITFSGIDQVLDVFRLCPKLTHLRACLDFTVPGSDDVYADIRRRSGGLKHVALFQIPSSWNDRHIRALVPSEASMVSLDYNVRGPSRFDLLAQLHAGRLVTEGFMFGQLCGPIRGVVLQSYTGVCSMEMSDAATGRALGKHPGPRHRRL
ncbi:hypothetical protein EXIGLDRAFT_717016 [Exidia glandulosa HHB12029]|uniref:F-box domain-containing protein n=1 Tax=Exidia glandulosa HHB12029 TaxID=1314781 RepID=A0A165IL16_EXIGL|nr:hypothetical protein EXIGLDRAFT_717016 [Exidia glandulosa HHB12029]